MSQFACSVTLPESRHHNGREDKEGYISTDDTALLGKLRLKIAAEA